jgi:hypothetical protein
LPAKNGKRRESFVSRQRPFQPVHSLKAEAIKQNSLNFPSPLTFPPRYKDFLF